MSLSLQPMKCKMNRHKPDKGKARWDGDSYVGTCLECDIVIRRESKGIWRKEWISLALLSAGLGLSAAPGTVPAYAQGRHALPETQDAPQRLAPPRLQQIPEWPRIAMKKGRRKHGAPFSYGGDLHGAGPATGQTSAPWQCLYLLPDPQGHGALRLICRSA